MATQILRPTSSDAGTWTGDNTSVDEAVTQPDRGNESDYLFTIEQDGETETLGFGTIADVDEVTNVTVWTYAYKVGGNDFTVDVNMGGWQGAQGTTHKESAVVPHDWDSCSFDGNWDQADLDDLQVKVTASNPDKLDTHYIDVLYVVVIYSELATNWGHEFIGVAGANIDSVSGVDIANIASIKGVDV